jgi:hypothetical protein
MTERRQTSDAQRPRFQPRAVSWYGLDKLKKPCRRFLLLIKTARSSHVALETLVGQQQEHHSECPASCLAVLCDLDKGIGVVCREPGEISIELSTARTFYYSR